GQTIGPEQTPDPGEWVMFIAVNGRWQRINPLMRSTNGHTFNQVHAGDDFRNVMSFDYWLPQGVAPTLYVSGRECDIPLIDCTKERYGAPPRDPSNPFNELGFNDKPGRIEFGNTGLPLAGGEATYQPIVNPVPSTSNEDY